MFYGTAGSSLQRFGVHGDGTESTVLLRFGTVLHFTGDEILAGGLRPLWIG